MEGGNVPRRKKKETLRPPVRAGLDTKALMARLAAERRTAQNRAAVGRWRQDS
jgi:hypothetical protein